jgi:two-component system response regulator HydG
MKILVIDDQRSARRVICLMLGDLDDLELVEAGNLAEAQAAVEQTNFDLLLVDIRLSDSPTDRGGLDFLRWLRSSGRSTPAVMVTGSTELAEIREAMRLGAQDYVLKDELCPEMLLPIVEGMRERMVLKGEVFRLRERVEGAWGTSAIVGSSPAIDRLRKLIERVADADCTVLIRGETGTGKEMVARALHQTSARRNERFLAVNCSALPGTLIESMIFGHERGAFTGAVRRVRGQLQLAGAGTVLLDEIAEMPLELQAKLLRVLEDRRFQPLGSEEEVQLRARVLAATHVDLKQRIAEGTFRQDLYYRLNVVNIEVPPLVDRREDLPELVHAFVAQLPRKLRFDSQAMEWLLARRWQGNVRELKNAIERLALLAENDDVDVPTLIELVGEESTRPVIEIDRVAHAILSLPTKLGSKLDVIERAVLHHAIEMCGGNKSAASRLLGLERKALERKLERFGSEDDPGNADEALNRTG